MSGDLPGGPVVKNPPFKAGDTGSIPGQKDTTCCRAAKSMGRNKNSQLNERPTHYS